MPAVVAAREQAGFDDSVLPPVELSGIARGFGASIKQRAVLAPGVIESLAQHRTDGKGEFAVFEPRLTAGGQPHRSQLAGIVAEQRIHWSENQ